VTLAYSDNWLDIHQGDARSVLETLASDSVDCVVTSPPYWGLRDYGTAEWEGGDPEHEHRGSVRRTNSTAPEKQLSKRGSTDQFSGDCDCGATRVDAQLGLEATPEEYVANMVEVFREVKRVLKPTGTVWLNLGDSYNGYMANQRATSISASNQHARPEFESGHGRRTAALKAKDLVGIPWRVAFALQADGWYLRSDIIWSKPNPMPESVTDRPTKAHEYLFLLSKSQHYFYDQEAVREALAPSSIQRINQPSFDQQTGGEKDYANGVNPNRSARKTLENFAAKQRGHARPHQGFNEKWDLMTKDEQSSGGRNMRSVWTITTRPYPGAHFAVFPPELPEKCILAGSSAGGSAHPVASRGNVLWVSLLPLRGAVAATLSAR